MTAPATQVTTDLIRIPQMAGGECWAVCCEVWRKSDRWERVAFRVVPVGQVKEIDDGE